MAWVPDRGEIIWIDFDPQVGHEQARRRPALVLSPAAYNAKTSLCVLCPMTHQVKGYPFEVPVEGGVVLADQVKSMGWRGRRAESKAHAGPRVTEDVIAKLTALIS